MDASNLLFILMVTLVALIAGVWLIGSYMNHKRRAAFLDAVTSFLAEHDQSATIQLMRGAGFRADVKQPWQPYRQLLISVALQPRQNLFLLLVHTAQGGGDDRLLIAANLLHEPKTELLWTQKGRPDSGHPESSGWTRDELHPFGNYRIRGSASNDFLMTLQSLAADFGDELYEVRVQVDADPQLQVRAALHTTDADRIHGLIRHVTDLAEAAGE